MAHDHLSIEWTTRRAGQRGERPPMLEDVCLVGQSWSFHREQPLLRIEDPVAVAVRYIPFTSIVEVGVHLAPITCHNETKEKR